MNNGYDSIVQNVAKYKCLIIWFHFTCRCAQKCNKVLLLAFQLLSTDVYNLQKRHLYSDIRLNMFLILVDTAKVA